MKENILDILSPILSFYYSHNDLIWKVILGFFGGFGGYLWKVGFLEKLDLLNIKWSESILYSLMGMVGGICILNPATPLNAFAAGLIGIITMKNFINQHSKTDTIIEHDVKDEAFDEQKIKSLYNNQKENASK